MLQMNINSDINILGGLPDFNLIKLFVSQSVKSLDHGGGHHSYTAISTEKAVKRFERAIRRTLLHFTRNEIRQLVVSILNAESISNNSLLTLFWNASVNNDLLAYLNKKVYFPAFFSGRIGIRQNETIACLRELRETEMNLQKWSDYTLEKTGSKYLTLLKKFGLMEGGQSKTILHPYLNDQMLIVFIYWLLTVETKPNLLDSEWLKYSFLERKVLIERIMQKKFSRYIDLKYSGDKLKIEPTLPYTEIYDALT
jgi:hypothetical protein